MLPPDRAPAAAAGGFVHVDQRQRGVRRGTGGRHRQALITAQPSDQIGEQCPQAVLRRPRLVEYAAGGTPFTLASTLLNPASLRWTGM